MATDVSSSEQVSEMDAWINRYRAFAEGVVVMVCPVLLAIRLNMVNLKSEDHGSVILIIMLVVAALTLITGIFPFLICHLSSGLSPRAVTKCLAPVSSLCLVALACWIIHLIIFHNWLFPVFGSLFGLCIAIRTGMYCFGGDVAVGNAELVLLENSVDFLAGITALLFVGLESLALEGHINRDQTTQNLLTKPMGASFLACIFGVFFMVLETAPPLINDRNVIVILTKLIDVLMTFGISLVIFFITHAFNKIQALLVFAPSFLIFMMLVFNHVVHSNARNVDCKPASLELIKVTFTGFLAVSVPSISKGSHDKGAQWFIFLAAAAVVSGLAWRLLTHYKSENFKKTASFASFCTHLLVAVAAIPFTVMAGNALF